MAVDLRLRGYLQEAVLHELGAAQQYVAQGCLAELWGLDEVAARFRRDAAEELGHLERLTRRSLLLGVVPRGGPVPPVRLGRTVEEMLLIDRALEQEVVRTYDDAAHHAAQVGDEASAALFLELLEEELEHLASIEQALWGPSATVTEGSSA